MTVFERNWVEWQHPGWKRLVETETFMVWLQSQPRTIIEMAERSDYGDILSVLEIFKLDCRSSITELPAAMQ